MVNMVGRYMKYQGIWSSEKVQRKVATIYALLHKIWFDQFGVIIGGEKTLNQVIVHVGGDGWDHKGSQQKPQTDTKAGRKWEKNQK